MADLSLHHVLDQLVVRFQQVDQTKRDAEQTRALAGGIFEAATATLRTAECLPDGLEERMIGLAQALIAWGPLAAEGLLAHLLSPRVEQPLINQFMHGCSALVNLAFLATQLGLQPAAAFRIAAACQLVFDVGRRFTAVLADQAQETGPRGQVAYLRRLQLRLLCSEQLAAVVDVLCLLQPGVPSDAALAFARTTAKPAVLLPWLATIMRGLALAGRDEEVSGPGAGCYPGRAVELVVHLLQDASFTAHAACIAANSCLQEAITTALLTCSFPNLAIQLGQAVDADLPDGTQHLVTAVINLSLVLQHAALAPAVAHALQGATLSLTLGCASAIVSQMAALSVEQLECMTKGVVLPLANRLTAVHLLAAKLLGVCCSGVNPQAAAGGSSGTGCSSSENAARAAASGGPGSAMPKDEAAAKQAVAWELVATVPTITSALRSLLHKAPADGGSNLEAQQAAVLGSYGSTLQLLTAAPSQAPLSEPQLLNWAAAAEASLRLQPVLLQQSAAKQPVPAEPEPEHGAASQLASQLLNIVVSFQPASWELLESGGAAAEPGRAALRRQLTKAHLNCCRLAHWLVQRADQLPPAVLSGGDWLLNILRILCCLFAGAMKLELAVGQAEAPPWYGSSPAQALCVTHLEGAAAFANLLATLSQQTSHSAGSSVHQAVLVVADEALQSLPDGFGSIIRASPHLAAPSFAEPLAALLALLPEQSRASHCAGWCSSLLDCVLQARDARCAVALVHHGLLLAAADAMLQPQLLECNCSMREIERQVHAICTELGKAAEAALAGTHVSRLLPDQPAQLSEAAKTLQMQQQAALGSMPADALPAERAGWLRQLLLPAADLAALMQQYYDLPATAAEGHLAVAQAAAGRCCAYLRCTCVYNGGDHNGPAAGQQAFSKRCSACRAVWYCGIDCARANWLEGGHRSVCKALGEARRAAKAAWRAARQTQQAARGGGSGGSAG